MIVDVSNSQCQTASFGISTSTSDTRQWDIKVTQYACGDEDNGGPPGCLQYFTGTFGDIASYGFPPSITTITSTVSHLKNQYYDACFRRESGYCYLCYSASFAGTAVIAQNSFGLSVSQKADATGSSNVGTQCTTDYLIVSFVKNY